MDPVVGREGSVTQRGILSQKSGEHVQLPSLCEINSAETSRVSLRKVLSRECWVGELGRESKTLLRPGVFQVSPPPHWSPRVLTPVRTSESPTT